MIAGFDEAGRGSLIGSLYTCLVVFDKGIEKESFYGFLKDSKKLSKKRREELFSEMQGKIKFYVKAIPPQAIDKESLTFLELKALRNLLKSASKENTINTVYVDKFSKRISCLCKEFPRIKFIIEHKADSKYKVVSAASIIAKVFRDKEIEEINKIHRVGSGYPSDERCREYVSKNFELIKPFVRKRWKTLAKLSSSKITDY